MLQLIPEICFIYHLSHGSRRDDHCQGVNFFFRGGGGISNCASLVLVVICSPCSWR